VAKDEWEYPGDEAILKAVGETLRKAREDAGLSMEEAARRATEAGKSIDVRVYRRAVGLAIRNARDAAGMDRKTLGKKSGVPLKVIVAIERAQTSIGVVEFVRISYALKILPHVLAEEQQRIEQNILDGKKSGQPFKRGSRFSGDSGI
jgi:ribosome-binding protein aMBF1 (putative translation factor)